MISTIYELAELIDKDLAENIYTEKERIELSQKIKPLLSENAIVIAQINPYIGDIKKNVLKAKKWINYAELLGLKAIIFPELYLVGMPAGDFILRFPIVARECLEWLKVLSETVTKTKVIIGFPEVSSENDKAEYYNSLAILSNGKIERIIRKTVLPLSAELNDYKYFTASQLKSEERIIDIGGKRAGITLIDEVPFNKPKNYINPAEIIIKEQKPDIIINCSSSISRTGKELYRNNLLSSCAKKYQTPVISVNQTGASDNFSYDGASRIYNNNGELIFCAKSFEEQFFIVNPFENQGKIYPKAEKEGTPATCSKSFSLDYELDLERTYKSIIQSIRDYFKKSGFKHACLGLSGGLDSTVCATLLTDALGKENVFGISMPSKITTSTSKNDAKELAQNLGIHFLEIPIKDIFDATRNTFDNMFNQMESKWDFRYKNSYTNDNIQARARANILWGITNEFESCLTIATSDKSEAYMGYATVNGDMSGGFAPIADVTKTKLFALAKWMNKNRKIKNAIPQSIIEKRPGAELAINPETGKPLLAEEALMPYEFLDEVIWRIENLNQTINDMIDDEFVYEKTSKITREQKSQWLEKFFRRMAFAAYKWSITVPAPIVDSHSIIGAEYHQPILASGINYKKTSLEDKSEILKLSE